MWEMLLNPLQLGPRCKTFEMLRRIYSIANAEIKIWLITSSTFNHVGSITIT
jgi:hypothetical protein